ncbi:MAG: porin family protein [Parabacteroides sp.]
MNWRKVSILAGLLGCLFPALQAQRLMEMRDKSFNFGAKVGLNTVFPYITELTLDGVSIDETYAQYKVGYLASIFCRFNTQHFFVQPALTWQRSVSEFSFFTENNTSGENDPNPSYSISAYNLAMQSSSLEVPVLFGYHIVRQSPYGLSLMAGPKLRYIYQEKYTGSDMEEVSYLFEQSDKPITVNVVTGVSVTIGQLFFDFTYEFGLPQKSDFLSNNKSLQDSSHKLHINRHTNVLNFSLGILF